MHFSPQDYDRIWHNRNEIFGRRPEAITDGREIIQQVIELHVRQVTGFLEERSRTEVHQEGAN
jgi:hypothetical protein